MSGNYGLDWMKWLNAIHNLLLILKLVSFDLLDWMNLMNWLKTFNQINKWIQQIKQSTQLQLINYYYYNSSLIIRNARSNGYKYELCWFHNLFYSIVFQFVVCPRNEIRNQCGFIHSPRLVWRSELANELN